jgi:transcriptional regulator with XRE-family HTH domain
MPAAERALDRAARLAERLAHETGDEIRETRLMLGQSQEHVASSCHLSRGRYRRIELGRATNLSLVELHRISAVLGLSPSLRLYPSGVPVRDAGHTTRLERFMAIARPPLTCRPEVPLPRTADRPEMRAWDMVMFGRRQRTAVELEMRLRDVQAMRRRIDLKRRDDPTESFLLLLADTRGNRRVLAEFVGLFADLPRLRPNVVRAALAAGRHPPSGLLLI